MYILTNKLSIKFKTPLLNKQQNIEQQCKI